MNIENVNDVEIYRIAAGVLSEITHDFNGGIYAKLGGNLNFSWVDKKMVTAWAESKGNPDSPPNHEIILSYELARQVYRDIEGYYEFAASALLEEPMITIFNSFNPKPQLPDFDKKAIITNMYLGAITWVFFHELGHLTQEHGYIRSIFGKGEPKTRIEDCESDGEKKLEGKAATISHVTELAADVYATYSCIMELIRHFSPEQLDDVNEESKKLFQGNLYLMVCGISCIFYRFNGERLLEPHEEPIGSHPTPIRRLELCIPNIFERLDVNGTGHKLHGMDRSVLVNLCIGAAESVGFFWLWPYIHPDAIPEHFFVKGVLQDPYKTSYWKEIIESWDEIKVEINKIKRFGNERGLLFFTDELRDEVFS
ncbi:MAG: hypothetical protein PHU29_04195 [Sulfuricurvum sp.]|nr:hypothetical protein [Sulfuricurvum sp.]